jgi:hypothetical protein
VFYQGEWTPAQESTLAAALPSNADARADIGSPLTGPLPSARVVRVDVANMPEPYKDVWTQLPDLASNALPHVVVRARVGNDRTLTVWHGALEEVGSWNVFQSPARDEIARRLLAGHSVVWLLVTSDDQSRNEQVRKTLDEDLQTVSGKIALPDGIGQPGSELYSEIPLLVKFSVLEIRSNDPQEAFLLGLFRGFRPETLASGDPLVVPVFGRGRALEVLPASKLTAGLIEDLCGFLSGACSCQVKDQNPGFDLLFAVDWNQKLFGEGFEPPPAKTIGDRAQPQLLSIPPGR